MDSQIRVFNLSSVFKTLQVELSLEQNITPVLRSLHWLPIKFRLRFKILLLTYKCLNDRAPSYLSELLTIRQHSRTLRSAQDIQLLAPKITDVKTAFYGARSFSVSAPRLWNELPSHVKSSQSICAFKRNLKTYLFRCAFINM